MTSTNAGGDERVLEEDLYKIEFKYYKAKVKPPDVSQVVDPHKKDAVGLKDFREVQIGPNDVGIKSTVKVTEVKRVPGLLVIPEAFTPAGLHHWTHRSLFDFPERPNVTNLDALAASITKRIGENKIIFDDELRKKLRWSTLGYHHDWNTKVYDLMRSATFPSDLARCAAIFAERVADYEYEYRAEAAIVNYYPVGTTLSGHVDHSEEDQSAPLVSISLGCTCVFLIGGPQRSLRPTPIFLRHGDVVIMTGGSRLAYHGVPRVFAENKLPYRREAPNPTDSPAARDRRHKPADDFHGEHIERRDVRQCALLHGNLDQQHHHLTEDDGVLCTESICSSYLTKHRININIRQVHKPDV